MNQRQRPMSAFFSAYAWRYTFFKDEFISEPYPAWTAIGVTELITEGTLVEIRAIAKRS